MNDIALTAVFEEQPEGGYVAYIAEVDGVNTQGETMKEAEENLVDAFNLIMGYRRDELARTANMTTKPFIPMLRKLHEEVEAH
jgi:predicted RNase H-like HicB family nuclease